MRKKRGDKNNKTLEENQENKFRLPEEIYLQIFSFLAPKNLRTEGEVKDLGNIGKVCRTFHRISLDNMLWRSFGSKMKFEQALVNIPDFKPQERIDIFVCGDPKIVDYVKKLPFSNEQSPFLLNVEYPYESNVTTQIKAYYWRIPHIFLICEGEDKENICKIVKQIHRTYHNQKPTIVLLKTAQDNFLPEGCIPFYRKGLELKTEFYSRLLSKLINLKRSIPPKEDTSVSKTTCILS
ncbi:F-box-like [Legionella lansingensis]|uniref:F-box-like protein n=1 Tax=Legionella lansingensis TaxID=45067 RepID=A0A0W0VFV6_9GAMM|nr:F-box protein [Legionella lansingensis]KTD18781.1 F-box-like protein [Legionella lansingensis]SNV58797.1 F-box-like [Legionella lansingensis]